MSYVLVSLVGDEVTQEADAFARQLGQRRAPTKSFHEPSPSHEIVSAASEAVLRAVIVAHNGSHDGTPSLRSHASGAGWADGNRIGATFRNARVYAYACETMGKAGLPDVTALGNQAHRSGVRAFAGHAVFLDVAWQSNLAMKHRDRVIEALCQMVFAFLDGENDANRLRLIARGSYNLFVAGVPLDLGAGSPEALELPIAIELAVEHIVVAA